MQLEADAREALPYVRRVPLHRPPSLLPCCNPSLTLSQSIENCTKPLGPLRQAVFACLTCKPPPANANDPYEAAGVCYACSVQCHGEHTLVEIFNKRNFTCDCGTKRFPETSPCNLRINAETNVKGGVHSEEPASSNSYNQNFRNRFCGCECDYDPFQQKGTMFQCLGLGTNAEGGCGEDWWHPGCLVGLGPDWFDKTAAKQKQASAPKKEGEDGVLPTIKEDGDGEAAAPTSNNGNADGDEEEDDDVPPPPGFPADDEFEGFICYQCLDAFPWLKRYGGTKGFLAPVYATPKVAAKAEGSSAEQSAGQSVASAAPGDETSSKKRKASDEEDESQTLKRQKSESEANPAAAVAIETSVGDESKGDQVEICRLSALPPAPEGRFSLFFKENFRESICRCSSCFPLINPHPQLLEEEETYEPPVSEEGSEHGASTHGSGSLLERGESALRNVDRVRAIEGVMAYNHLKDKLKPFFQQFAESGEAISAEHIKEYFAKLRGDEQAIKDAGEGAKSDFREEQSGY